MGGASDGAPKPGEFICLDATPLLTFNRVGRLATLKEWFPGAVTPAYVMTEEILEWQDKYPENKVFDGASWPSTIATDATQDAAVIDQLGQFFAEGSKNIGELHVMALTHRFQGTAILDDNGARRRGASLKPPVKSVFMVSMVAAAVQSGLLTAGEAWELHHLIESSRDPMHAIIRTQDKKEFEALLHFFKQVEKNRGWKEWPYCLHDRLLDGAAISARKGELQALYQKLGFGKR